MNALGAPPGDARPNGDAYRAPAEADSRKAPPAVEALIEHLAQVADPRALESAQALVRAILDMHCAGLARILEHVSTAQDGGGIMDALARDDLVGSLLLLHGLHPLGLEARARAALGRVGASGFRVELLGADEGVLRVGVTRSADAKRAAGGDRVRVLIEQAIEQAAPDAEGLVIVGDLGDEPDFIPLDRLRTPGPAAPAGRP